MVRRFNAVMKAGKVLLAASDGVETEYYKKETHKENGDWTRETRVYLKVGRLEYGGRPNSDYDYIAHEDGTINWTDTEERMADTSD